MRSLLAGANALAVALVLTAASSASAGERLYRVKLTEITIPDGASLGEVRRTFQPFPNWTLICDENLKVHTRVCNVTQNIIDVSGTTILSWSLAATERGYPVFILRVPASLGPNGAVAIQPSTGKPLAAKVQGCDATICVASLPLGTALSREIARGEPVTISYTAGQQITLSAPLNGLAKAVAAIKMSP